MNKPDRPFRSRLTPRFGIQKAIALVPLLLIGQQASAQTVYHDRSEYERAKEIYTQRLESHTNYQRKIDYYKSLKYDSKSYRPVDNEGWIRYFQSELKKRNVSFDSYLSRYRPGVEPNGETFINLFESSRSRYLLVTITDTPPPQTENLVYYAVTFRFDHPGKPPVYEPKAKPRRNRRKAATVNSHIVTQDTVVVSNHVLPIEENRPTTYLMPDGNRYTYTELLQRFPSLKTGTVFNGNFK